MSNKSRNLITMGFNRKVLFYYLLCVTLIPIHAQNWRLTESAWETSDAIVAGFSVNDYGATGDGVTDVTAIFQSRINALAASGGGTLFVPEGRYVFKGTLILRKGVVLRGEWKKPVKGQPVSGTILMVYAGRGNENDDPFITMESSSALQDLAFWYPEQQPANITVYPPAILMGNPDFWGNDYCNVRNVTLVNAYSGIIYSRVNGGGCPYIMDIYGTPLSRGIEIDNIYDVGRIDQVHFSPSFWEGSGLPDAPAAGSPVENWLLSNGTGIVMRRNDWSYTCFVTVEGYQYGLHIGPSIASLGAGANGHYYALNFKNCGTGIYFETTSDVGIMFARVKIENCNNGITIGPKVFWPVQLHTCEITATQNAITTDAGSGVKLMMQKCTLNSGQMLISGGTLTASDCDFNDPAKRILIGPNARAIMTGNRFSDVTLLQNHSLYTCHIEHTPVSLPGLPEYADTLPRTQKPARMVMYNVTGTPFYAVNDGVTDNTSAIQNALNTASAEGGGIVFLPPGKYKVLETLTIPTGVELKGALDIGTSPMGPGSILEVYSGKGNASGTPFITMNQGSGLRGVVVNYPEQLGDNVPDFFAYPYCIRVAGNDAYIVNVGIRAAYNGIDLFTNRCDNHYLDYIAGQVLNIGIRIGGGSTGGKISNIQFNPIGYAFGYESKWGEWSNAPSPSNVENVYNFIKNTLQFMVLDNCSGETLYNNFHYGSQIGLLLNGASGVSMGTGIDASRKGVVINSVGAQGFDLINSQIVSVDNLPGTCYIQANSGFTGEMTFFNSDYWGWTEYGISQSGGNLNFQLGNFQYPGSTAFANITGGNLILENSAVMPVEHLLAGGDEPHLSAGSSVLDDSGINPALASYWEFNLPNDPDINSASTISRTGWIATASINNTEAWRAIDNDPWTRWDTGTPKSGSEWFKVDMITGRTFNKVILKSLLGPYDYPYGYEVYVSNDGINWGSAVTTGHGSSAITVITFPVQTARHIKLVQTGSSDTWWWSIDEYYVAYNPVAEPVTSIRIFPGSVYLNPGGDSFQLTDSISPVNAGNSLLAWTSSDPSVATVNTIGQVTPSSVGSTLITATAADGGLTATSLITVYEPVTGITIEPENLELQVGSSAALMPIISPEDASFQFVTWNSGNWSVATVSPEGLVTGISEGTTIITVKTSDGDFTTQTHVNVISNPENINEKHYSGLTFRIVPNPVSGNAIVAYESDAENAVTISIHNTNGTLIHSEDKLLQAGQHSMTLQTGNLEPGMYFVHFSNNAFTINRKMMVRKE